MRGLEPHRDFEARPAEGVGEARYALADEGRMRFDDDLMQSAELRADRGIVALGHGSGIEEVRGVVQLHARDLFTTYAPRVPRSLDLRGDRAGWCVVARGEPPEIAH